MRVTVDRLFVTLTIGILCALLAIAFILGTVFGVTSTPAFCAGVPNNVPFPGGFYRDAADFNREVKLSRVTAIRLNDAQWETAVMYCTLKRNGFKR